MTVACDESFITGEDLADASWLRMKRAARTDRLLPAPKKHDIPRPPDILNLPTSDHPRLPGVIRTPMWTMLENGCSHDFYAEQFPKSIDHATIAFGAAGYGCQPHDTPQGVETYFSWIYDRLNIDLDLPAPLLMHTIAFPGTEWDQSQRHEHLSLKWTHTISGIILQSLTMQSMRGYAMPGECCPAMFGV